MDERAGLLHLSLRWEQDLIPVVEDVVIPPNGKYAVEIPVTVSGEHVGTLWLRLERRDGVTEPDWEDTQERLRRLHAELVE